MIKPYQIGIDLGGTKTESILFSPRGKDKRCKSALDSQLSKYKFVIKVIDRG